MRSYSRYRDSEFSFFALIAAVVVVIIVGLTLLYYSSEETKTGCHVVDKDRTSKSEGGSDMRVYTSNCGNFKVDDAFFKFNFHSSDTYREIKVGKTYDFDTLGWRIPFFSEYPNILSAKVSQ